MKKKYLILIAITTIAAGCQKYEEGPCISFRSPQNRLYGTYTLTKYTIDGVDSIKEMANGYGTAYEFYYSSDIRSDVLYVSGGASLYIFRDPYEWIDHKKTIRLKRGGDLVNQSLPNDDLDLEVMRLKNNDIHFRSIYKGKEYYFEMSN